MATTKRVRLGSNHHASLAKHTISDVKGSRNFPSFDELEIAAYPGQNGCYLFRMCADGQGTDTWHETIEDALAQAEWEFGVKAEEWTSPPSAAQLYGL
jgi:hypothetical protein